MSSDIFVQDLPQEAETVADIPNNFRPSTLGKRSDIIAKICDVVPMAEFSDPSWGMIDGDGWSIEINIGTDEECEGFALCLRGGGGAAGAVAAILKHLNLRALVAHTGEFFTAGNEAEASFLRWQAFRDRVINQGGSKQAPE